MTTPPEPRSLPQLLALPAREAYSPQSTSFTVDSEQLAAALVPNRLADFATILLALTFREMMDFQNSIDGGSSDLASAMVTWATQQLEGENG
jgi:hypothetical protein